jgi:tRNA(Ile)-lysidine synthase
MGRVGERTVRRRRQCAVLYYVAMMVSAHRSPAAAPTRPEDALLHDAIVSLPDDAAPLVLAISGGVDSMALLHAMVRWAPARIATVATFDHGTGAHAREAASLVAATARRWGVPVVRERAMRPASTEAAWRAARWEFLRRVARGFGARVATAHSADDQLETMVQRLLRGTGTRGLAALAAPGPVVRPWLELPRAALRAYAEAHAVPWLEDPANRDRRHQRVRLRLDLLPALEAASPGVGEDLRRIGRAAAAWRAEVDALVRTLPWREVAPAVWQLDRACVHGWSEAMLAVLWPALLGPLGVTLTADGTRRVVRFTIGSARAGELRLPGGAVVVRSGNVFEVRGAVAVMRRDEAARADTRQVVAGSTMSWPGWRFVRLASAPSEPWSTLDASVAAFPPGTVLELRRWEAGDRIVTARAGAGRRIARYLSEAGIPRLDRGGWPVVLEAGEVVWVPGVCRGLSAPHRSGRSDLIWYRSEREFG